jgi:hypothetical protein
MDKEQKDLFEQRLLERIVKELESDLARYKADPSHETGKDMFSRGLYAGYEHGLKRAVNIVNYEIGIRQDPPNISYGVGANRHEGEEF